MKPKDDLLHDGIHVFGPVVDVQQAAAIHRKARQLRQFGPGLFLSEQEYEANPQHWGVNPREGFNFIDQFAEEISCIERQPQIEALLKEMLGDDYVIHNKKFVCGIPETWLPDYLKRKMAEASINNLGAYMKPEFRDITYFHGIDFHQDIIDWPAWKPEKKTHEFLTLYVYIHDVTENDAPLFVLPGSHKFGATRFPHAIAPVDKTHWRYGNGQGKEMTCEHVMLTGQTGYAAIWHSCLVHGTQQIAKAGDCRLSLRYIIQRGTNPKGLRALNETIEGPLYLDHTREDLDASGKVAVLSNTIRKI
jgi:hypothetical protein